MLQTPVKAARDISGERYPQ